MTNEQIVKEFAIMQNKLTEMGQKIDALYAERCNKGDADHANNEDAVCELSETTEDSIADLEQAICDLSEEIGG